MKNKIIIIFFVFSLFLSSILLAENVSITAKNISLDKENNVSIFEDEVVVKTRNKTIQSDYAKYDRESGYLILEKNIIITDEKNNKVFTNFVEYFEKNQIIKTKGKTTIQTAERYFLEGEDLFVDNTKKIIKSEKKSVLTDRDGNKIYIDNFEYSVEKSLFKSVGFIEIQDVNENEYEFSQVYIDTKKKEIIGTDSKAFINSDNFKINKKNNPRVFSNTLNIKKESSTFDKSVFTLCQYRKNDKCPPWTIQSKKNVT